MPPLRKRDGALLKRSIATCHPEAAGDAAGLLSGGTAAENRSSVAIAARLLVEHAAATVIGTMIETVTVIEVVIEIEIAQGTESRIGDAVGVPGAEAAPATASETTLGTETVIGTRTEIEIATEAATATATAIVSEIAHLDEIGTAVQAGAVRSGSWLKTKQSGNHLRAQCPCLRARSNPVLKPREQGLVILNPTERDERVER